MLNFILAGALALGGATAYNYQAPQGTAPAAPAAAVTLPDTPAGKALSDFVATFNEGGDKRKAWLETRTTMGQEQAGGILKQDADFLAEHGPVTVVKVPQSSASSIEAVIRHAKSGAHGYRTLEVGTESPYKVTNMQLRGATPEEIK